ncbi:MAG: universal stress protein [Methanomassiliicoccales archaeon]|nr:universal stress protein [Methanomassiliicoccales archaeon]
MFRKLLIPVDLSPQSLMMVYTALRMKEYGVLDLVVYSAVPDSPPDDTILEDVGKKLDKVGMKHELVVQTSTNPAKSILKVSGSRGIAMIAMAASGKGRMKEFFVGSTSLEVIRGSKVPVLLDKFSFSADNDPEGYCRNCPKLLERVLVSLDLSKVSNHIQPYVQSIIDAGAKNITLFHVVQAHKYKMSDDDRFKEVKVKLEEYRDRLEVKNCKVDVHIHFGTTTYNILEVSREMDATLIVLGTTGRGYLRGATLGSTSEEVIKGSTRPMLLIPS